jgi:hypothetical protein
MARNTYVKTSAGWEQIASTVLAVPQGLVPVVPTSVAGTGVSFTGDGLVSFSGSATVSLNGVFNSAFDNYLIIVDVDTVSGNTAVSFRMRAAGTDAAGAGTYGMAMNGITTGGAAADIATTGTSATFAYLPTSYPYGSAQFTIVDPAKAVQTRFLGDSSSTNTAYAAFAGRSGSLYHTVASAYDGITMLAATNMTGTIRIYGYSKGGTNQSAQIQPFSQAAGTVAASATSGSTSAPLFWDTGVTVTFPAGRFSVAPIVTASASLATALTWSSIDSVTSTGFTVRAVRVGSYPGSGTTHRWQATQMTSSSASG